MMSGRVLVVASLMTLIACSDRQAAKVPTSTDEAAFWTERSAFRTRLTRRGPAPQGFEDDVPSGFEAIRYRAGGRELLAWIARPKGFSERRPAIVFAHGGFALGTGDDEPVRPFLEAGYVALVPSYRGENGNPGDFEMFLGEVDDAIAAIRWLALDPQVDPARIYVFGHSAGGAIAAMLSLAPDVPVAATASIDALYAEDLFDAMADIVPFDRRQPSERRMRLLLPNLAMMKRPHRAYLASDGLGYLSDAARAEARRAQAPLEVITLPGNHITVVPAATRDFFDYVQAMQH
jgi:acetyl esterase/lipase